jgi:glycosyltransferase involved in cell wall biosynthesis
MIVRNEFLPDSRVLIEGKALQSLGYDVEVLAVRVNRRVPESEIMDGLRVTRVAVRGDPLFYDFSSPFYHLVTIPRIVKAARELECEIYHCHDLYTLPAGAWMQVLGRTHVIYDAHEPSYASLFSHTTGRIPRQARWLLGEASERLLARFVSAFIVTTEAARESKTHATKVFVVPYRPNPAYFNPNTVDAGLQAEFGDDTLLLYVGTIDERKGLFELLGAVSLLRHEIPGIRLLILGSVSTADGVSRALRRSGMEDRVEIRSWVPYWEVPKYINVAKLGVIPIRPGVVSYARAIPNKLLDFMACGLPVVCSALPEMKRIVEQTKCGTVVDPLTAENLAEGIRSMLESDLAFYRRNALQATSDRYRFSDVVSGLQAVYGGLGGR